jgi:hypothetical protein
MPCYRATRLALNTIAQKEGAVCAAYNGSALGQRHFCSLAYLGFVSLGLPDGLLGVAWPSVRTFYHLPLDDQGDLLVIFTTGDLLSSFSSGWLLARHNGLE